MESIAPNTDLFECEECGLHYRDEKTAKKCVEWCLKYSSCNMEITALSIERTPDN